MGKNMTEELIKIRELTKSDIPIIVEAFKKSQWTIKPASLFEFYLEEKQRENLAAWVAYFNNQFCGYVILNWKSKYQYFRQHNIPEIMDLNVLPSFRKNGVGTRLIQQAEKTAASRSKIVGIDVGLYNDYGSAQKLYVKLGYLPNGDGVTWKYKCVHPGESYPIDDDLILWFTKELSNRP